MKKNNTFKKWIALFLSVAMVAVSGITTNTSMRAADDTVVQESNATDGANATTTEEGAAAENDSGAAEVSPASGETPNTTQEINLNNDEATDPQASDATTTDADGEKKEDAKDDGTDSTEMDSKSDDSDKNSESVSSSSSSSSSSSEEAADEVLQEKEQIQKALEDATESTYTYDDNNISVTAVLTDPQAIPDEAEFRVTPITQNTDGYNYQAYMNALNNDATASSDSDAGEQQYTAENTLLYDMAFIYNVDVQNEDGTVSTKEVEIQPAEGAVKISVDFKKDQLTDDLSAESDSDVEIKHLPLIDSVKESTDTTAEATNISASDVRVEDVKSTDVSVDNQTAEFKADAFSAYAFTVNGETTQISAGTSESAENILGDAIYYGIVADSLKQSCHMDSNFAAINYDNGGCNFTLGAYTSANNPGQILVDKILNQIKITTKKTVILRTSIANTDKIAEGANNTIVEDANSTEIQAEIDGMLNSAESVGLRMLKEKSYSAIIISTNDFNNNDHKTIDFTSYGPGTFYIDGEDFFSNIPDNFQIAKNDNQVIVFNFKSKTPRFKNFSVNGVASTTADSTADKYARTIVFNMPNATSVSWTGGIFGIVLAPKATISSFGGTSSGWLVAKDVTVSGGEWHCVSQNMPEYHVHTTYSLGASKLVNNTTPSTNKFIFTLEKQNGTSWEPIDTVNNDGSEIKFKDLTAEYDENRNSTENVIYRISEPASQKIGDVTYSADGANIYYAKVAITNTVKIDNNKKVYGADVKVLGYYSDEACTNKLLSDTPVFNNKPDTTSDRVSIKVTKAWADSENQDGIRPDSVTVQLYADGKEVDGKTLTLSEINDWTGSFDDLDAKKSGKDIKYTVQEVNVPDGYTSIVTGDMGTGFTVTNTHETEKTVVSGTKTWNDNDNQDGARPESVTIRLLADGKEVANKTVTEKDNWSYSFTGLPKYANGKEISYTVTEDTVTDYMTEISGYNVKNTHKSGKTSVTVTKAWTDSENQDGKRPESVTVQLYADGEAVTGKTLTLSETNNWTGSFGDLDAKKSGKDIEYTVQEVNVPDGYTSIVTGDMGTGFTITNIYTKASVTFSGTKTLEGQDLEANEFSFQVTEGSNNDVVSTGSNNADGSITFTPVSYSFGDVGEHTYTVSEVIPAGAKQKTDAQGNSYYEKDGIRYSNQTYTVTVNVTDNGDGTLNVDASDNAKRLNFTNSYEEKGASAVIRGSKTINGGAVKVKAGQFRFNLLENNKVIDTATNDADGEFVFSKISYTSAGTYTYTIEEQNAGKTIDGIKYQTEPRTVTITVSDNGNGQLVADNVAAPAFDNTQYGSITVKKSWNDAGNESNRPSSVVVDLIDVTTGKTVQTAELSDVNNWTATFDQIIAGNRYTVHEEETSAYYSAENNDQVVTADVNGKLVTLVNDYVYPAVTIYANKVLNGGTLTSGEFTFYLYRNSDPDTVVKTATNNASGEIFFTGIAYDAKGYTVREAAGDDASITYDSDAITYDADGNITSTGHTEFTNTQRPILLRVQKRSKEAPYDPLEGATYGLYQVVEGGNDILVESEISDENGYMYYGRIQPGVIYYFKEIAAPEGHEVDPYPGQKFQVKYTGNGQIALYDENGNPTTVGDITGQDSNNLLVQYTAEKTAVDTSSSLSYSDDSIVAVAEADNSNAFAAGTKLKVTQLSGSDAKAAAAAVEAACGKIDSNIAYYDIQFIDASGNEVEPAGGDVTVTIQYKGSLDLPEGTDRTALKLVHLTKEANGETTVEAVPGTVAADQDGLLQTSFTSDSFSTFGVVEPGSNNTLGQNYLVTAAGVADQVSELKVAKLDTAGKYIKGAKLQIIEKSTGTVRAEWTTTDGPKAFARWFDDAKTVPMNVDTDYILHEVSAPDGYELADDIQFRINKYDSSITVYKNDGNGNLVIDQEAIDKWVSDTTLQMIDVPVKHETVTLVKQKLIPNEKTIQGEDKVVQVTSVKAVKTGDTTPIALFVILLVAAASVLLILVYRGRRKKDR